MARLGPEQVDRVAQVGLQIGRHLVQRVEDAREGAGVTLDDRVVGVADVVGDVTVVGRCV